MVDEHERGTGAGHSVTEQAEWATEAGAPPPPVADPAITADQRHLDLKRILGVPSGTAGLRRRAI